MRLIVVDKLIDDVMALPDCPNGFSDTYDKQCLLNLIEDQEVIDIPKGVAIAVGEDNTVYLIRTGKERE